MVSGCTSTCPVTVRLVAGITPKRLVAGTVLAVRYVLADQQSAYPVAPFRTSDTNVASALAALGTCIA